MATVGILLKSRWPDKLCGYFLFLYYCPALVSPATGGWGMAVPVAVRPAIRTTGPTR